MTYRWTTKDLDDLETFYREEVAPEMREEGLAPEREQPPYAWMTEHGFSEFIKSLRRDHDLTPTEFYDRLNVGAEDEDDYWKIEHGSSRAVLNEYIDELLNRRGHPETTVMPVRSRLILLPRFSREAFRGRFRVLQRESLRSVCAVSAVVGSHAGSMVKRVQSVTSSPIRQSKPTDCTAFQGNRATRSD